MTYITIPQSPHFQQISFEEILAGKVEVRGLLTTNAGNTRTIVTNNVSQKFIDRCNFAEMVKSVDDYIRTYGELMKVDRRSLYDTFFIPKKTGGVRRIDEPKPELMTALHVLKSMLEQNFWAANLYHTSAFAYVKGRSTVDAVKRHQQNESNWFLKTDFSNFFGSTTEDFVMSMLGKIFPFSVLCSSRVLKDKLRQIINLCFLDGGLPQGTPMSPMLTNIMMIPFDHAVSNGLRQYNGRKFVYTRYADDITLSCKVDFDQEDLVRYIDRTLESFHAPFRIKPEKTHYGSRAGNNWILGLMLNKDNNITIGRKRKLRMRDMLFSYITDKKNGVAWDASDVRAMDGTISYYEMVEPAYVEGFIRDFNKKYGVHVKKMIRDDIS